MFLAGSINSLRPASLSRRVIRLCLPMVAVLCTGTAGFSLIEGWPIEKSVYFTIITFTTVGYGDFDLSLIGRRFASVIILLGFGIFTYVLTQLVQMIVEHQLDWERVMHRKIRDLSDHFIVVGYGRIGAVVCKRLSNENIPFVVIDRHRELVEQAARAGHIAIASDATNDEVLEMCRVREARGLVCLTTSDANNIVITLSARTLCPDLNIISRAESDDHARKLRHAGATRVISPVHSGAVAIANTIVRPHTIDFLDQSALAHEGVEFSKVAVTPGSFFDGRAVAAAPVSAASLLMIVAVQHADGSTLIAPPPDHVLNAGDALIIAGHPGAVIGFCADAA
ncbi:MAG: potassium channel protein [Phycisphaerales bacterium]|nr:potassium channel protein [Phycisphaerales bacterium]